MIRAIKELTPCRWSKSEKAWHFEPSNTVFQKLKANYPEMQPLTLEKKENLSIENFKTKVLKSTKGIVSVVQYQNGRHRIIASYNTLLIELLKTFPYASYDKANKCWSSAIEDKQKKALEDFCSLQGLTIQWEDMRKKLLVKPRLLAYEIPNYRTYPDEMLQKLETKRYSVRTITTYKQLFEELLLDSLHI